HKYADKSRELKAVYNENFGPLTPADNLSEDCWEWVHGPWPWEN
ncbi:MAG: spore coat protein CotJB, partial [Eubacteriales bacterium]